MVKKYFLLLVLLFCLTKEQLENTDSGTGLNGDSKKEDTTDDKSEGSEQEDCGNYDKENCPIGRCELNEKDECIEAKIQCDIGYIEENGKCVQEEKGKCITGDTPIPDCLYCDVKDENKCGTCKKNFELNKEDGTCKVAKGAACLVGDNAIEFCKKCDKSEETKCGECKKHYKLESEKCQPEEGSECITGKNPIQNCDICDTNDKEKCSGCEKNYNLTESGFCQKKSPELCKEGKKTDEHHCIKCSKEDASNCGKCENRYYIAEDGTCHLCSADVSELCEKCNSKTECKKCVKGYIVIEGKCVPDNDQNKALKPKREKPGLTFGLKFMKPAKNQPMIFFSMNFFRWLSGIVKLLIDGEEKEIQKDEEAIKAIEEEEQNEEKRSIRRLLFKGLRKLEELNSEILPEDGENEVEMIADGEITSLNSAFKDAVQLTSFEAKEQNTGNITSTKNMFKGCSLLTDVDLSSLEIDNLQEADGMFSGCSSLETLDLDGINFGEGVNIKELIEGLTNLKEVSLGESSAALLATQLGEEGVEGASSFEMIDGKLVPKSCSRSYYFNSENHTCAKCDQGVENCLECASSKICTKCNGDLISIATKEEDELVTKCLSESELSKDVKLEFVGKFNLFEKQAIFAKNLNQQTIKNGKVLDNEDSSLYLASEVEVPGSRLRSLALRNIQESDLTEIKIQFKDTPSDLSSFFEGIETLNDIKLTQVDEPEKIKHLGKTFASPKLKNADLSAFISDSITDFNGMFEGLNDADTIDISGITVKKEDNIDIKSIFSGSNVKHIIISQDSGFSGIDSNCEVLNSEYKCEDCINGYRLEGDVCKEANNGKSYKSAFIAFLILFLLCFVGCGVFLYFICERKKQVDYNSVAYTNPTQN